MQFWSLRAWNFISMIFVSVEAMKNHEGVKIVSDLERMFVLYVVPGNVDGQYSTKNVPIEQ